MAWSSAGADLGPGWSRVRAGVLRRAGYVCVSCGDKATEADHIISRRNGGSDDPDNLQALCRLCHSRKSAAEGNAAKNRLRNLRRRPTGRHPGKA